MRDRGVREQFRKSEEKHAVNEQIRSPEVRLIGVDGAQIGVVRTEEAIRMAEEAGVDVVEVASDAKPPVCRLLDYGKLRYREQKKAAETRRKSSSQTVKELRVRYSTDTHDLEVKIRNARKFLEEGDKVRFLMRFKGREVVYHSLGLDVFKQIVALLADVAVVEDQSPLLGQRMVLSMAPKAHQAAPSAK